MPTTGERGRRKGEVKKGAWRISSAKTWSHQSDKAIANSHGDEAKRETEEPRAVWRRKMVGGGKEEDVWRGPGDMGAQKTTEQRRLESGWTVHSALYTAMAQRHSAID